MITPQVSFQDYPYYGVETPSDIKEVLRQISAIRKDDVEQIRNLPNIFITGRKVGKVPTSSADVDPLTDKLGDVNWDLDYIYILVDDGADGVWRRATLGAW